MPRDTKNGMLQSNPAIVIRRLAEAADGFRGRPVWFVLNPTELTYTSPVYHAFSPTEARELAGGHDGYFYYGPFLTPPDPPPARRIASILVRFTDGTNQEVECEGIDALFFSNAAREKFMYPYYDRLYGPAVAAEMQASLDSRAQSWTGHDEISLI